MENAVKPYLLSVFLCVNYQFPSEIQLTETVLKYYTVPLDFPRNKFLKLQLKSLMIIYQNHKTFFLSNFTHLCRISLKMLKIFQSRVESICVQMYIDYIGIQTWNFQRLIQDKQTLMDFFFCSKIVYRYSGQYVA